MFYCESLICAKALQQLLPLIKAAYGTYGAIGSMETKLQCKCLSLSAVVIKPLIFECIANVYWPCTVLFCSFLG